MKYLHQNYLAVFQNHKSAQIIKIITLRNALKIHNKKCSEQYTIYSLTDSIYNTFHCLLLHLPWLCLYFVQNLYYFTTTIMYLRMFLRRGHKKLNRLINNFFLYLKIMRGKKRCIEFYYV